jgi:hypothetical protein
MGKNPFFFPSSSPLSPLGRRSPPAAHLARAPPSPAAPSRLPLSWADWSARRPSRAPLLPPPFSCRGPARRPRPSLASFFPPPFSLVFGPARRLRPSCSPFPGPRKPPRLGPLGWRAAQPPNGSPAPFACARAGQLPSRRRLCAWGPPVSLAVVSCSSPTPTTPLSSLPIVPVARNRRRRIRSFDPAPR